MTAAIGDRRIRNSNFLALRRSLCSLLPMTTHSEKPREISPSDDSLDWDALRLQSLAPGGLGSQRAYIWHASSPLHHSPPFELYFQAQTASR